MKNSTIAIVVILLLAGGYVLLGRSGSSNTSSVSIQDPSNVVLENGQQIVTITAKGGYFPETTIVQPGIPTIIRFATQGTYDCSSAVRIPSLSMSKNLSSNGTTDITIGTLEEGQTIQGTCSMGMYGFELQAQS